MNIFSLLMKQPRLFGTFESWTIFQTAILNSNFKKNPDSRKPFTDGQRKWTLKYLNVRLKKDVLVACKKVWQVRSHFNTQTLDKLLNPANSMQV